MAEILWCTTAPREEPIETPVKTEGDKELLKAHRDSRQDRRRQRTAQGISSSQARRAGDDCRLSANPSRHQPFLCNEVTVKAPVLHTHQQTPATRGPKARAARNLSGAWPTPQAPQFNRTVPRKWHWSSGYGILAQLFKLPTLCAESLQLRQFAKRGT